MNLTGKYIAILGVGRSGRAAAALALREGATVSAWDLAGPEAFAAMPDGVELHPHAKVEQGRHLKCDILVVSPGIDTYGDYVKAFSEGAGQVIGEVELASWFYEGSIVGITGTNGKTTTTELVSQILMQAGLGGLPCGNYGVPFAEVVLMAQQPAYVSLELSSFQLETISSLKPAIAIWLNFAADHMDRYPTLEAYRAAKLRIFENQTSENFAIVRAGENLPTHAAQTVSFSIKDPSSDWFLDGFWLSHHGIKWLNFEEHTQLRGLHNAENLMAALAVSQILGIDAQCVKEALSHYNPPAHRCEYVRTLDGVEYLNDSKATNLHALESAIHSLSRPIILIVGGKEKGLDYSPLVPRLVGKVLAVISYGQIAQALCDLFAPVVPSRAVSTLAEAVPLARILASTGSTVLLSPGTSSFDQFSGYEHRGNVFRDLVHQLA